jgi:dihydrofolate reductase
MNMILAVTKSGVIGIDNKIPWYIKADLQRFRELTSNNIVVMGRRTFESLPNRPFRNRINIVITKDPSTQTHYENVFYTTINKVYELIEKIQAIQEPTSIKKQVFVIGGEQVYNYFINETQNIYLTLIDKDIDGDTFFNTEFLTNSDSEFAISKISEQQICPISKLPYTFIYYQRKN